MNAFSSGVIETVMVLRTAMATHLHFPNSSYSRCTRAAEASSPYLGVPSFAGSSEEENERAPAISRSRSLSFKLASMQIALCLLLALSPAAALAVTPESSRAVILAAQTGEVIGAASVCGVPEKALLKVGREIIGRIRDWATTPAEIERALLAHERAVERGAARVRRAGEGACHEARERFRALTQDDC